MGLYTVSLTLCATEPELLEELFYFGLFYSELWPT